MELTDKQKLLSKQIDELSIFNKGFFNNIILKNNEYKEKYLNNKLNIFDLETKMRRIWSELEEINKFKNYSDKSSGSLEILFNKLQNNIRDFCIWLLENDLQYYFASDNLDVEYLTNLIKLFFISCCANIIIIK